MFSRRTAWSLAPNALHLALAERRGRPCVDLTLSNPTLADLPFPDEAGLLAALASRAVLGYAPEPLGRRETRAALAAWLARHGLALPLEQLCLTASTSEAYAFLFKLLCDPGDSILVPEPSYPLFDYLAGLEGVALHRYPLRYDGEWHIDFAALDAVLRAAETASPGQPRALVTLHPNNPTGSYLKAEELEGLVERCATRGLALISDEVFYEHRIADPRSRRRAPAPRAASRAECLSFSLGGLSKLAGLPQLKLGWIAANGPPEPLSTALARLEVIADTYLSVSTPAQQALPAVLAGVEQAVAAIGARLRENLATLDRALEKAPHLTRLGCEGGWLAILRLPATRTSEAWALHLLETADLLVQPGYFYGLNAPDAYVVVSLLCAPATFSAGASMLAGAVPA